MARESHNLYAEGWAPSISTTFGLFIINLFSEHNENVGVISGNYKTGIDILQIYVPDQLLRYKRYYLYQQSIGIFLQYIQQAFNEECDMYINLRLSMSCENRKEAISSFLATYGIEEDDISHDSIVKNNYRFRRNKIGELC